MNLKLLSILCCPCCRNDLECPAADGTKEVENGTLSCTACGRRFPIVNKIPRFVPKENYADNFGFQWNEFRTTQLDSHTMVPISRDRFYRYSGWSPDELRGKCILDVGCGAGRFTEIALAAGATVIAIDYSTAVEACSKSHGDNDRLSVCQADIYQLPFKGETFDFVYCFGVLQHTPDVEKSFKMLPDLLKEGARLAIDLYPKITYLKPYYWIRPITKRIPVPRLFGLVRAVVPYFLPISRLICKVPFIGRKLRNIIPVANYDGVFPLSEGQLLEWSILDTFDNLSPTHDHPQSLRTIRRWFEQSGLVDIEVFRSGFNVGRGTRPRRGGRCVPPTRDVLPD